MSDEPTNSEQLEPADEPAPPGEPRGLRAFDASPGALRLARALRRLLPGDKEYGDPLSTAGSEPAHLIGQRLSDMSAARPSAARELGMGVLQVWQSLSEAQGRGRGDEELTLMFTDLVGYSSWTLDAGDTLALELLRRVGRAIEPEIECRRGRIVKRLGDGLMVTFRDPVEAVEAALACVQALKDIEVAGHNPRLRAGIHLGRPRRLGGDYYGTDVNIAARLAAGANANEVLVSDAIADRLGESELSLRRRRMFRAKGAPKDLKVFAVSA